ITDGQFMPTTLRDILKAGEIIDPHDLGDVIPLMARYLMPYWGESPEQINKAIGRYNSPKWYRTHVTTVAKLVEARWKELESEFNSDE
ncbi:MAG: hypothetical protein KDD33_13910, partial [Bdellovibrionales bacterium]|nr:hypothetical protein [Bdellovibrionales bacterium]